MQRYLILNELKEELDCQLFVPFRSIFKYVMPLLNSIKFFLFRGLVFSAFCLFLFACQEENHAAAKKEFQEKKALSFSKEIVFPPKRNIVLLPDAKKATSKWLAFITAQAEITKFENFTVQEAVNNARTTNQIMTELQKTVPSVFQVKPVLARLNVLVTLSKVLLQKTSDPNTTAKEIEKTAKKIPAAFAHLKIQLNEVFRKGIAEFELELDQKADSLEMQKSKDTLFLPSTSN